MIKLYYFLFHTKISKKLYKFLSNPVPLDNKKHNRQCFHYGSICDRLYSFGYIDESEYFSMTLYLCYRRRAFFTCWCGFCKIKCPGEKGFD